ncbi:MAG: DegT/DnrJ/EryC1/StrS family aminotransferase [Ruminococcus sp.]|nr:DegT/DnrJ/EryC1/StrS family aminotransferase [Ruminococcus sp.]
MINVTQSSLPPFEEYCDEIKQLWSSHWLTNMGEKHKLLQNQLEQYLKVKHVTLYTNGHLALEGALSVLDLKKGGEVITTPFTFASTTHAIVRSGFVPVFCDIKEADYTIDPEKIESLINENTVAILPVHVYGNLCDVDAIEKIAQKYHLKVLYDAAHAFGVQKNGVGVAGFGDMSMFSFHATKVFNTIEGGAVCFNDDQYIQVMNDMKNFGIRGTESCRYVGGNAKMNEFQASMGICNLRYIDQWIIQRKRVLDRYMDRLSGIKGIKLNTPRKDLKPNYAYFPVVFDGYQYTRDEITEKLQTLNIRARKYFYPLTCDFECYQDRFFYRDNSIPVARHIAERVLTLPIYPELEDSVIDLICDTIMM